MWFISHRGNLRGPDKEKENQPAYILEALRDGFDVEIDVWCTEGTGLYLGHDRPQYEITFTWLKEYSSNLWLHCKNIDALIFLKNVLWDFNYFWHESDTVALTSQGMIWCYPGKQPIKNSVAVLPEIYNDNVEQCAGICSDYIINYRK